MPRIVRETTIARAPAAVFALLADLVRMQVILSDPRERKALSSAQVGVGSRTLERRDVQGRIL